MKKRSINILALQETRVEQNTRQTRKDDTWFFSGEGSGKDQSTCTPGVAIITHSSYTQYLEDIEPVSDRIMHSILRGTMPTNIIAA